MDIKEIAQWVINNRYPKSEQDKVSDHEMYHYIIDAIREVIEGESKKIPERYQIQEHILSIIQKNYKEFKGTNEAELASSEDIADYLLSLLPVKEGEESGWISVEDRLPENTARYLCALENGIVTELGFSKLDKSWFRTHSNTENELNVIFWQNLPSPPIK